MVLSSVAVKNFQSIGELSLDLGPITVITGSSNSGKSAFVRAIRTALSNARGSGYMRDGKGEASVFLDFAGHKVLFTRSKSVAYEVDGESYSAMAGEQPAPLAGLPFDLDLQVSDQFDKLYMVTATPSQCAQIVTEVTSADRLMAAVDVCNSSVRSFKGEVSSCEARVSELSDKLDGVRVPEGAEDLMARIDGLMVELSSAESVVRDLTSFRDVLLGAQAAVDSASPVSVEVFDKASRAIPMLYGLVDEAVASAVRVDELGRVSGDLVASEKAVEAARLAASEAEAHVDVLGSRVREAYEALDECPACGQRLGDCEKERLVGV